MRNLPFLIFLLFAVSGVRAQQDFQTIVTEGPVAVGESFQVQYVLEDRGQEHEFFAPDFKGFRFVSGPNIYTGSAYGVNGTRKLKNIVYTLEATHSGDFVIPGASVRLENRLLRSSNVMLQVLSKAEALQKRKIPGLTINEDTYLAPGEDPSVKTRRNLFIKVMVDKKSCFVGEPVTAIFKLYSRLYSKSDIVKNPGFYGFTVQDMINLDNKQTTNEKINGKDFDVHIVRKVQLYPLQAGRFSVDPMEVRNKVRFSRSAVDHKPEQEIMEGVVADPGSDVDDHAIVFENTMETPTIPITVNPVPAKDKPGDYMGATGNFQMQAMLAKNEYAKNEEGELIVTVSGKGNFPQLSAPAIDWPAGIEGFEPTVKDELDPAYSPLQGKREFHFRFVSARPGLYKLPELRLSFFNPDTNHYKVITAAPLAVTISQLEKQVVKPAISESKSIVPGSTGQWWLLLLAAVFIFLVAFLIARKKRVVKSPSPVPPLPEKKAADYLRPAHTLAAADDHTFYKALRNGIWEFFAEHLKLAGSQMNKHQLRLSLDQYGLPPDQSVMMMDILERCDTGIFTGVEYAEDKQELLEHTAILLGKIQTFVKKT